MPLGSPVQPLVTLGVANCDATTASGKRIAPWTGGLAGTRVAPTGTRAAFERDWLWNVGDSPQVDKGFDRLGLQTALVPQIRLNVGPSIGGFTVAHADVPWRESPYRLEGRVADASQAPLAGTSVFWHHGPRGLVKVTYEISNGSISWGSGRVSAEAGSPLARLVGTNPSAVAVLVEFDFESLAEIVGQSSGPMSRAIRHLAATATVGCGRPRERAIRAPAHLPPTLTNRVGRNARCAEAKGAAHETPARRPLRERVRVWPAPVRPG